MSNPEVTDYESGEDQYDYDSYALHAFNNDLYSIDQSNQHAYYLEDD